MTTIAKILLFPALGLCAFVFFLYFIGGGTTGRQSDAIKGLLFGGTGLAARRVRPVEMGVARPPCRPKPDRIDRCADHAREPGEGGRPGGKGSMTGNSPLVPVTAMPADTNPYGGVFGGWLMGQMGLACGSFASRHTLGKVVAT